MSVTITFGKLESNRTGYNHGTGYDNGIMFEHWSLSVRGAYVELKWK